MSKMDYFYQTMWVKMGRWALFPADSENWHGEETSKYFKKTFGIGKGTLAIHIHDDVLGQNCYFPESYFGKLYDRISEINRKDYKGLEKILNQFYVLKKRFKQEVPKIIAKDYTKLTNSALIDLYQRNRDWAHQVTVFDQFGWIAEEYWTPLMKNILVKHGIPENSGEYYRVLFTLTKPEEISTTLEEKREVLKQVLAIKQKKQTLNKAAQKLAHEYGWMPVFTFGTPWDPDHYLAELAALAKKPLTGLKVELEKLKKYSRIRNAEFFSVIKEYKLEPKEVQVFIDFGLALDTRNEGEYCVSLAGYYLLPIYKEMAKRLALSVRQLRLLYEKEIVAALEHKIDPQTRLEEKGKAIGWGFGRDLVTRINFTDQEARKLHAYIEKKVKGLQGNEEGLGVCASPGKVSGVARVINTPEKNDRVKTGDILVTEATTVDYLPAMKRAAAFVTEVGGLTCHAAVVAREFGVPCVVGFKNATKHFKDGEKIEVNADKGIVRKVK